MAEPLSTELRDRAAEIAGDVLARAALVHRFDPFELMPADLDPSLEVQVLARIAREATETEWPKDDEAPQSGRPDKTVWRLTPEARRRMLGKLAREGKLEETLARVAADKSDTFAGFLASALRGRLDPAAIATKYRDSAAAAASFAAEALGDEKSRAIAAAMREKISEQAEEERASGSLGGRLVDRREERAALDAFVESGAIADEDRLPEADGRAIRVAAYLLTGPSGAGKSALVADLVRRWRGYRTPVAAGPSWSQWWKAPAWAMEAAASYADWVAGRSRRWMGRMLGSPARGHIAVLDLGRLATAVGGEVEWTTDLMRQLGTGDPDLAKRLSQLRKAVRADRSLLDPSGRSVTALWAGCADLKQGLAESVAEATPAGLALVVVIDDFEEALIRSFPLESRSVDETLFGRILLWADSLATLTTTSGAPIFDRVRVIAAGKDPDVVDDVALGRWFMGRHELVPLDVESASGQRSAPVSDEDESGPAHDEAGSIARYRKVGALRLCAAEVALLPAEMRAEALLARMDFARRQGRPDPRIAAMAEDDAAADAASGDGDAEARAIAKNPERLFAFLQDRELGTRIDYAFTFGDFDTAARAGWEKIGSVSDLPDLSEPWRLAGDPVMHWTWQTALAALTLDIPDDGDLRSALEVFLRKFAERTDPARSTADATGLVFAAAATIALGGRLSPALAEATQKLGLSAVCPGRVRTYADMRLLALRPLWGAGARAAPTRLKIPYRRLRIFSASVVGHEERSVRLDHASPLIEFIAAARGEAPTARAIDAFVAPEAATIELSLAPTAEERCRTADILVGVAPEVYDCVVVALADADADAEEAIDGAIAAARDQALVWPRGLSAERNPGRDRDRRAGFIARAVVHADRCGLLGALLESADAQVGSARLSAVTRLVQRYEALRQRAFEGRAATAAP